MLRKLTEIRDPVATCITQEVLRQVCDGPRPERLIIFTRHPEPGQTKTRLIPALGPQGAADLQRQMAEHTIRWAKQCAQSRPLGVEVRFEGGSTVLMRKLYGDYLTYRTQGDGDLGDRLARSFAAAFRSGMRAAVAVGTDCPALGADLAAQAFDALRRTDLVLGPATDGGYYLIGLRSPTPQLFAGIPWGTDSVAQRTLRIARELGLTVHLLPRLSDVDRPEDLAVWNEAMGRPNQTDAHSRISILIPTLNEAGNLARTLVRAHQASNAEIIVVDGGSIDDTLCVAQAHRVRTLSTRAGRAHQMNVGAAAATGDVLLFLHADTELPDRFDILVLQMLAQPGVVAGAFELRIDSSARALRIIERAANLRSRYLQMPYGDQALFLRADVFRSVGGFPDLPIMEDFELVRRLRRRGRIALAPAAVATSARRWLTLGVWQTTLINQLAVLAYCAGISPSRVARWFWSRRSHITVRAACVTPRCPAEIHCRRRTDVV